MCPCFFFFLYSVHPAASAGTQNEEEEEDDDDDEEEEEEEERKRNTFPPCQREKGSVTKKKLFWDVLGRFGTVGDRDIGRPGGVGRSVIYESFTPGCHVSVAALSGGSSQSFFVFFLTSSSFFFFFFCFPFLLFFFFGFGCVATSNGLQRFFLFFIFGVRLGCYWVLLGFTLNSVGFT